MKQNTFCFCFPKYVALLQQKHKLHPPPVILYVYWPVLLVPLKQMPLQ